MRSAMKAAVFESVGKLVVKDVPVPAIKELDDIICEVELCSVCGTDVHIMSVPPGDIATPGTILGHELVGRIVEVGAAGSPIFFIDAIDRIEKEHQPVILDHARNVAK